MFRSIRKVCSTILSMYFKWSVYSVFVDIDFCNKVSLNFRDVVSAKCILALIGTTIYLRDNT